MIETRFEFLRRVVKQQAKAPAADDILETISDLLLVLGKYIHYKPVSDADAVEASIALDALDYRFSEGEK